jgi:fatty acyl-CoA reductase
MVVNGMMVAMAAHSEEQQAALSIYHLTSSLRQPAPYAVLAESVHRYFLHNPPRSGAKKSSGGEPAVPQPPSRMRFFRTLPRFHAYMAINFRLPLEVLRLLNIALCGAFSRRYDELSRKYRYAMHVAELYAPYTLFKGW